MVTRLGKAPPTDPAPLGSPLTLRGMPASSTAQRPDRAGNHQQ